MKAYLTAWLSVALAGAACAQGPAPAPGRPDVVAAGGACCPAVHKVCVPQPTKTVIEKTVYRCRCEDFCLPRCPGLHHTPKDCRGCPITDCPACGRVRTRKVLIKKFCVTECEGFTCVPVEACTEAPGCCPPGSAPGPTGPQTEQAPAPGAGPARPAP